MIKATAYFGTTDTIYGVCIVNSDKRLYFDKLKEPRHKQSEIHFSWKLFEATCYALNNAIKLNHTPIILEGVLPYQSVQCPHLNEGDIFPIDFIWIPKREVDWRNCNPEFLFKKQQKAEDFFIRISPKDLTTVL